MVTEAEEWRPVREFPDHYEISNKGRLRRIKPYRGVKAGRIRKPCLVNGYPSFVLKIDQRPYARKLHRMLVDAFLGPIPEGMHVNHKNGIRDDFRLENLEIVTPQQNKEHAYRVLGSFVPTPTKGAAHHNASLSWEQVCEIRSAINGGTARVSELSRRFGISRQGIWRIATGKVRLDG